MSASSWTISFLTKLFRGSKPFILRLPIVLFSFDPASFLFLRNCEILKEFSFSATDWMPVFLPFSLFSFNEKINNVTRNANKPNVNKQRNRFLFNEHFIIISFFFFLVSFQSIRNFSNGFDKHFKHFNNDVTLMFNFYKSSTPHPETRPQYSRISY